MLLAALLLAAQGAVCPPQKLQAARFTPGEALDFRLDALGADVGTFEVRVHPPPSNDRRAALELTSHARTSAFVSTNVARYDAFATALLATDFAPLHYREDVDEGEVHRAVEVEFPPVHGALPVRATRNGEPEPLAVDAGSDVRDILSTLYLLRSQHMKPGTPVCVEVFAGRKIWKLQGQVSGREAIDTPLGRFRTLRVDAEAALVNNPGFHRAAHVWLTDDDRRLPLVAIGEVRGKVIRAQLIRVNGAAGSRRVAEGARRK